jgi:hypothetical protein
MAIKRLTKSDAGVSFGVFSPVGHLVLAFENDEVTQAAARALRDAGFDGDDVLVYSASEEAEQMGRLLDGAPGSAAFGHEVLLMRRYKRMADAGCGWLVVYAPDEPSCRRAVEVAQRFGAKLAEKYHRLVIEDLI